MDRFDKKIIIKIILHCERKEQNIVNRYSPRWIAKSHAPISSMTFIVSSSFEKFLITGKGIPIHIFYL